jgi:DNA-directed RNA polymerases I and III subunit RPAC2
MATSNNREASMFSLQTCLSMSTYQFLDEDHTLGNLLRAQLCSNPSVEFTGYSLPHPSENIMNLRIQANKSTDDVLEEALDQVIAICDDLEKKWIKTCKKESERMMID